MEKLLLVTRPKYDDGTEYLSHYALQILKECEKIGIKKKDFEGKDVTSRQVSKFIKKQAPKLLFINGHGDENFLEGDKGEILFSIDKNLDLLKGRIIYARACHAGISLGKKAVEGSNGCFIGYKTPFSFWIDETRSATPAKDKVASLFLEPSNEVINCLIKGKTSEEAHEISKDKMKYNMREILKMNDEKEPGAMNWLSVLWINYSGQVLHGNKNITF